VIVCPRCGKENQDHYKFCLGCGAELPRDAAHHPKSFTAPTPPAGFPAATASGPSAGAGAAAPSAFGGGPQFGGAAAAAAMAPAVAAPAAAGGMLTCPQCNNAVPLNFKFCGSCGHPMAAVQAESTGSAPAAVKAPAAAAAPMPAPVGAVKGSLVLIRPDGTEGDAIPLGEGSTTIGRDAGQAFANDAYLSPKHATFSFSGNTLMLRDEDSLNGVYYRIEAEAPHPIRDGDVFRVGQEIIRFDTIPEPKLTPDGVELMGSPDPGNLGRVSLVTGREGSGNAYCVPPDGLHLGRERGDIIFPDDGYVSGIHCRIHAEGNDILLTDVGSSNGTFMRVRGEESIKSGSLILMGQQLFRVEY